MSSYQHGHGWKRWARRLRAVTRKRKKAVILETLAWLDEYSPPPIDGPREVVR